MTQAEILQILEKNTAGSAYGQELLERIRKGFEEDPERNLDYVMYLLDEKAYYMMAWAKKHEEEGLLEKAREEEANNLVMQKCIAALQPYVKPFPKPEPGAI